MEEKKIKENENDHLQSGDSPEERSRKSIGKVVEKTESNDDEHYHPESGDDPEERTRTSGQRNLTVSSRGIW